MTLLLERLDKILEILQPPQVERIKKDASWVHNRIQQLTGASLLPLDGTYWLVSQKDALNILYWSYLDKRPWIADEFDCDKFAVVLKAVYSLVFRVNSLGLVLDYGAGHAYNIQIFPSGEVLLIEPQTDSFIFVSERNMKYYSLQHTIIVI